MQEHIEDIVRALQEHLQSATVINGHRYPVAAVICGDGTRFSVQAGNYLYCSPRDNSGPWTAVEVMTLTDGVTPINWQHDAGDNLAGWVPIESVAREIYQRNNNLPWTKAIEDRG